jgi:hypothetical protein
VSLFFVVLLCGGAREEGERDSLYNMHACISEETLMAKSKIGFLILAD